MCCSCLFVVIDICHDGTMIKALKCVCLKDSKAVWPPLGRIYPLVITHGLQENSLVRCSEFRAINLHRWFGNFSVCHVWWHRRFYIHIYIYTYIRIYIYTYIHIYIYTYIHIYIFTYIRIYIYTYLHIYIYTYIHIYIYTYIHIYIHTYIYIYIHIYIYTYIHIYIYTYIHVYMYTYIHIYMYTCIHIYIYTYIHIYIYTYIHIYTYTDIHIYIYTYIHIYRLKAGGSPELRGTLSLDAIPERSFLYADWGGGVGWGGCNNVMWSALDDVESWKMLLGWKMLLRWWENQWCFRSCQVLQTAFVDMKMKKVRSSFRPWFSNALSHVLLLNRTTKIKETALQMVSMFHTSLVVHGRCKIFLFQHGQTSSSSAMKMELRLIKPFQRKK